MRHPSIGVSLIVIALLFGSLPIKPVDRPGLSLGWQVTVLIAFLGILLRWGPRIPRAGYVGWALMPSIAVFLTSLVSCEVVEGYRTIALWLIVIVVLILFLLVSRYKPVATGSARLRKVTYSAMIVFGLSFSWAGHIAIGSMRAGDFWHLDVAYLRRIILPHPYDYYIVFIGIRGVVWSSLLCVVVLATTYFLMRHSEEKRAATYLHKSG